MRIYSVVIASVMVAALAGCGGSTPTGGSTTTTTTLPPCNQSGIASNHGPVAASTVVLDPISVPSTGRLDITVDWTVAASHIGVYVVPANTCTTIEAFNARSCNFLVRSESGPKPRKVSTPNFSAGNYDLLLANFEDYQEAMAYQVILSTGSCPPFAGQAPTASQAGEPMTVRAVGRLH
jgi:hypothetical protein